MQESALAKSIQITKEMVVPVGTMVKLKEAGIIGFACENHADPQTLVYTPGFLALVPLPDGIVQQIVLPSSALVAVAHSVDEQLGAGPPDE